MEGGLVARSFVDGDGRRRDLRIGEEGLLGGGGGVTSIAGGESVGRTCRTDSSVESSGVESSGRLTPVIRFFAVLEDRELSGKRRDSRSLASLLEVLAARGSCTDAAWSIRGLVGGDGVSVTLDSLLW